MSDHSLLDNVRLWPQKYNEIKKSEWLMDYKKETLHDCLRETMSIELVTDETMSFQYKNNPTRILEAFDEDACYIQAMASEGTHQINTQGARKQSFMLNISDVCVCNDGAVYFTDNENEAICRLSTSGSVSKVFNTYPQIPLGICQSITGDLLVTQIPSAIKRISRPYCSCERYYCYCFPPLLQLTLTGEVIHNYKFQDHKQPITYLRRVMQNGNHDICVVNWTASTAALAERSKR
ncbi:uncharacterized protein LOC134259165 [Saccostrea cucullata]|uniref:uncharacterized protein LOC134259165 n=1 Tax=Saccostrea cuccullata TaxID=36930 RepID=UPI002ED67C78